MKIPILNNYPEGFHAKSGEGIFIKGYRLKIRTQYQGFIQFSPAFTFQGLTYFYNLSP
jgi:hypothetical protein